MTIVNKTRKNANTINEKVDNMTMAQEYFKRAIIVVVLYSLTIFLYSLSGIFNLKDIINHLSATLNPVELNAWIIVSLYFLIALIIIFQIILFKKLKKIQIKSPNKA
jgi:predicted transporter